MRESHCPNCGTAFVRVIHQEGWVESLLSRVNVFPFRCQLCTNRFRAHHSGGCYKIQVFDRRQYTRLPVSIEAQVLDRSHPAMTDRINGISINDISMDGCALQTTGFPKGAFIEMVLKPTEEESIHIETAMVCSVRPLSLGVRFLEIPPEHYRRLAQVVLGLLVSQGLEPTLNA